MDLFGLPEILFQNRFEIEIKDVETATNLVQGYTVEIEKESNYITLTFLRDALQNLEIELYNLAKFFAIEFIKIKQFNGAGTVTSEIVFVECEFMNMTYGQTYNSKTVGSSELLIKLKFKEMKKLLENS